ncbi:thyroglobulin isoform X1 [Octopus bimaculoides]|nr:thyroglobulin isoform X1 [Octopus bimaculoides]|eukprot:XP_014772367.1 PREDICTED: thyroglobulin-like isoform X1 [Octopus bimaculoides]
MYRHFTMKLLLVILSSVVVATQAITCAQYRLVTFSRDFPACEKDGSYSRLQCTGPICFCFTSAGHLVEDLFINKTDSVGMDCNCAVEKTESKLRGENSKPYRCLPNGNYDKVQCQADSCYCVNPKGIQEGDSVPVARIHTLPCYDNRS